MNKQVLVIMAAGLGGRYGGLKQIDSIDEYGHIERKGEETFYTEDGGVSWNPIDRGSINELLREDKASVKVFI